MVSAILGLVIALLGWQESSNNSLETFDLLISILILIIAVIGSFLFKIEIKIRKEIVEGFWQINDIRRYFLKTYNNLREHIHYEVKNEPGFLKRTNETWNSIKIVALLDSVLFSLFIFFVFNIPLLKDIIHFNFISSGIQEDIVYIIIQAVLSFFVFTICFVSFFCFGKYILRKYEKEYIVRLKKRKEYEYKDSRLSDFFRSSEEDSITKK